MLVNLILMISVLDGLRRKKFIKLKFGFFKSLPLSFSMKVTALKLRDRFG